VRDSAKIFIFPTLTGLFPTLTGLATLSGLKERKLSASDAGWPDSVEKETRG